MKSSFSAVERSFLSWVSDGLPWAWYVVDTGEGSGREHSREGAQRVWVAREGAGTPSGSEGKLASGKKGPTPATLGCCTVEQPGAAFWRWDSSLCPR